MVAIPLAEAEEVCFSGPYLFLLVLIGEGRLGSQVSETTFVTKSNKHRDVYRKGF